MALRGSSAAAASRYTVPDTAIVPLGRSTEPNVPPSETNASATVPVCTPAVPVSIPAVMLVLFSTPGARPVNEPLAVAAPLTDCTDASNAAAVPVAVLLMSSVSLAAAPTCTAPRLIEPPLRISATAGAIGGGVMVPVLAAIDPVTVSISAGNAAEKPLGLDPVPVSVIVSLNVPVVPVASVISGAMSDCPADNVPIAARPLLVNALEPIADRLPVSTSDGPVVLLTTPRSTTNGPVPCVIVPRSNVYAVVPAVNVPAPDTSWKTGLA